MAYRNSLIVSFTWSLLRSICWLPWRMACLLVCRFYVMLLFMGTMINRLLGISLSLIFLAIIFALISLGSLLDNSRSSTLLIRASLGIFLSSSRCVCICLALNRTVVVLLSLFLSLPWRFSIWSIVVLVTVWSRFLLCVHYVNSILI